MVWKDLARLNLHRSQCRFIQLFWRNWVNGENSAATTNRATGCLQADDIAVGSQFGARRSCASIFVPPLRRSEFGSNSDGTLSGTMPSSELCRVELVLAHFGPF